MLPRYRIVVRGGTTFPVSTIHMEALQEVVTLTGADTSPLFIRLFATQEIRMQPVTARALLAEIEAFTPKLEPWRIPGIAFRNDAGEELGRMYTRGTGKPLIKTDRLTLLPTYEGIHLLVKQFPPPVGFRSRPDLPAGFYECYFRRLLAADDQMRGERTEEMGGSGSLVALPEIKFPPATQWDYSRVAGRPHIAEAVFIETPALTVYQDVLHAVSTACLESLRLKAPVTFIKE